MKTFTVLMLGLLLPCAAMAGPITWTFQGVTFADGGTLTGSFQFDSVINVYSNINIVTTAGITSNGDSTGVPLHAYTFTSAGLDFSAHGAQVVQMCLTACSLGFAPGTHILTLYFSNDLGISGPGLNGSSPVPIDHVNSFQSEALDLRIPITGNVVASTPEPGTGALTVGALSLLGLIIRRRHV